MPHRVPLGRPLALAGLLLALCCALAAGCASKSASSSGKKGTQRPYTINGKTYHPMDSANGYSEKGVASWYGPGFHGQKTSSGEIYDQYKMTAAHKLLPMQTLVRVTNLDNGKSVEVRVNDRGPFVSGRIIDMSKAGAESLGMLGKGTAKVRVESLTDVPRDKEGNLPGPFYVQVGAFTIRANADRLLSAMKARGYSDSRILTQTIDGTTFHRVHAGRFAGWNEAQTALSRLQGAYRDAFVIGE